MPAKLGKSVHEKAVFESQETIYSVPIMDEINKLIKIRSLGWLLVCWMLGWPATGSADEGRDVYRQVCAVCHAVGVPGVPGVPKLGSYADWNARLAAGRPELLHSVLRGKGAMPPKGGDASLSDAQARAALEYMLSKTEVKNETAGQTVKLPDNVQLRSK